MVLEQPEDLGAARGAASRVETGYDVAMAGPSAAIRAPIGSTPLG